MSQFYRVTAPDFPCFGKSEATDFAWSVGDYADWLEKFILKRGVEKPHIVAHSFGARVAIKLLSDRGGLCDKLVLTGGAGIVKPRSPQYIRRVNAYRRVKKFFPKFAEKHFGSAEYRTLSPLMKESYKKIVNEDLSECAARISNATLLIYGENDGVTPPAEEGLAFEKLIENSRLEIMEGGHFCFSEHPVIFNGKLTEFLN